MTDVLTAIQILASLTTQIYNAIQSGSKSVDVATILSGIAQLKQQQAADEAAENNILKTGHI